MLTDEQISSIYIKHALPIIHATTRQLAFARAIEAEVRKEIEAAVLAEREQCAQLCDEAQADWMQWAHGNDSPAYDYKADAAEDIALAIRART